MDRYYPLRAVVPAATQIATPVEFAMPVEDAWLVDVEIVIPTGHIGRTGVRVLQSHQQIIPWANLAWITGEGYNRVFMVDNEVGADSLTVQAYNLDFFEHAFDLRFHLRDLESNRGRDLGTVGRAAQSLITPPMIPSQLVLPS